MLRFAYAGQKWEALESFATWMIQKTMQPGIQMTHDISVTLLMSFFKQNPVDLVFPRINKPIIFITNGSLACEVTPESSVGLYALVPSMRIGG